MADFLFEIGLEEVPARMIASAQKELAERTEKLLREQNLLEDGATVKSYSTPRRLAVLVHDVRVKQADVQEEMVGPSAKVAFKDGVPTAAAEAFAKKAGVSMDALRTITNAKGEYLAATVHRAGRNASEVIAELLPKEIAGIYWAKNMRWRTGMPERFVRPIKWMLALLDGDTLPVEWAGTKAGNVTYRHRVLHGNAPITIASPAQYVGALLDAKVMVNVEERRQKIRKALDHVTRTVAGAHWREDEALVDAVTHLTEWPSVLLGNFEREYLELPEEVLVTVMRDHQKYFALEGADGKLLPHFLTVLNTEPDAEAEAIIRQGNERVLRARFNDARFFWNFDQKTTLRERTKLMENVTFQKDLGSYAKKTERVAALATALEAIAVEARVHVDVVALHEAVLLAKTDLTTELVKEFTELQGVIGGLYARAQGLSETTAVAIYDQYLPASTDDDLPRTTEGLLLSIADKADTIAGMFSLGLEPTGSKDPFALRRAANGIVRMLAESKLPITLSALATLATHDADVCKRVRTFLLERVEFYLRDVRGQAYDVVKAVTAAGVEDVSDALARAEAITASRGSEDFLAIAAAFKRMKNILEQAKAKGEDSFAASDKEFLTERAERELSEEAGRLAAWVDGQRKDREYLLAIQSVAKLRPYVDVFFDSVMVMVDDAALRRARLGLLQRVLGDFSRIADFSEIVTGK
ncbi:MAG: glycine--tRNA ligase subunit beta [Acidobacteria bacterium]|nr:glycine--tRNA ligase subunit beta [Acidobacteriota bacterium]